MPFNGSGVFQRLRNWAADAAAGIKIRADYHDAEDDGFAAGLSNCITKDGQTIVTQNIPWNSKRITGLEDPVNPQDAATKAYADTKLSLTGGTINGNLDVAGTVSAFGYRTRSGTPGPYGDNWFNFQWDSTSQLQGWVDGFNIGYIATQTYANTQDQYYYNLLQGQINTKQANLGFTPVQQGGGAAQGPNKVYIGWSGSGLRAQVDSTDLGNFVFGSSGFVGNARLAFAGDISAATGPQSSSYEPYAGGVITGWQWAIVGYATVTAFRLRYMQIYTTSWFTIGYSA